MSLLGAIGQGYYAGQQWDQLQAQTEGLKQRNQLGLQELAMNKEKLAMAPIQRQSAQLQLQQQKQELDSQKKFSDYINSQQSADNSESQSLDKLATQANTYAIQAEKFGDTKDSEKWRKIGDSYTKQNKEIVETKEKVAKDNTENAGTAALSLKESINSGTATPEQVKRLGDLIGDPNLQNKTPLEIKTAANNAITKAVGTKTVIEMKQKDDEFQQTKSFQTAAHNDSIALQKSIRAAAQANKDNDPTKELKLIDEVATKYGISGKEAARIVKSKDYDALGLVIDRRASGGQAQMKVTSMVQNSAEALRNIDNMMKLGTDVTASAWADLSSGKGVTSSFTASAGNLLTDQQAQFMQVSNIGLGKELATVATTWSPRGATQAVVDDFKKASAIKNNDTGWTALFKMANSVDILRVADQYAPDAIDPKGKKNQEILRERYKKFPSPDEVMDAAKKHGYNIPKGTYKDVMDATERMKDKVQPQADQSIPHPPETYEVLQ